MVVILFYNTVRLRGDNTNRYVICKYFILLQTIPTIFWFHTYNLYYYYYYESAITTPILFWFTDYTNMIKI